jgi:acetyl esterase/lipase
MVKQKLAYDPSAHFEVTKTEVVYFDDGKTVLPMALFIPQGDGPFPALLRAHGGAWNMGDREGKERIDQMLAECGIVVSAIEFRHGPGYHYPDQIQDTNYAIRWLKLHAAEYNIDPSRFGGAGDSSGGHTMLLNAFRPNDPAFTTHALEGGEGIDASVDYVIAMWTVLDPYARYFYALDVGREDIIERTEAYFLNTEAMRTANPQMILERGEDVLMPPVLIIQGDTDDNIPNPLPMAFVDAYTAAGGTVQLEWFPGMPHSFAAEPGYEPDRAVELMKVFLSQQINDGGSA